MKKNYICHNKTPHIMKQPYLRTAILSLCAFLLSGIPYNINARNSGHEQTELKQWEFSKDGMTWQGVTVPHSCNALDGHSQKYYRGKAYYRRNIDISKKDAGKPMFLLFEGAAQAATVFLNGTELCHHKGGYTPFTVEITKYVRAGSNKIEVCTDNTLDLQLIPVSADFNKNNGLHNPVFLLKMENIYLSPTDYGMYRIHVSTPDVSRSTASTRVEASIVNAKKKKSRVKVILQLSDRSGRSIYSSTEDITLSSMATVNYAKNFRISSPHLWDGLDDPYLYNLSLTIKDDGGRTIDCATTSVGYRYCQMTAGSGFYLNGRKYPLRGVSEHQDRDGKASAVTEDDIYADYAIIRELGANFIRMAHYPHNDTELRLCDSLGIIVQTEIPWVNSCGEKASGEYFDNINAQMSEMITNLYNHPSIVFWGMWNEVGNWDGGIQGKVANEEKVVEQTLRLYRHAKSMDPFRYVGLTDCTLFRLKGYDQLAGDFFSENRYPQWYQMGPVDLLTRDMKEVHSRMGICNIAEYGGGGDPFCHTSDSAEMKKRDDKRHFEEYACYLHENDVAQIQKMPWLNFTSLWILFDFPVADRREGYMVSDDGIHFTEDESHKYMNDKGLVTRDRKVKKDPFYLYKALWNHRETTVYITGRRRKGSPKDRDVVVKVYSNAKTLTLYQNGEKAARLDSCPNETGVIWTFPPMKYKTERDTFKVTADDGTTDEVTWSAL